MAFYPSRGSAYGMSSFGIPHSYPSSGGYDLGGVWHPSASCNDMAFGSYPGGYLDEREIFYPDMYGGSCHSAYDPALHYQYYRSPMDYYGAYNSLMMYEEQLRMMHDLSEAERLALWQQRLQFEELCEEERALRYNLMADEERMRLGLLNDSHWGMRYGYGGGYDSCRPSMLSSYMSPWGSTRLPLSQNLVSRFGSLYGGGGYYPGHDLHGSMYGYPGSMYGGYNTGSAYGMISSYGGSMGLTRSRSTSILRAQADEARRLRRHARENTRQARRLMLSY